MEGLHVTSLDVNVTSASRRCALRMLNHQFETCTRACVCACTRARLRSAGSLCRTCRCAHHWLGRNDREVGQPLECLVVRRVASRAESRFLFSRALRVFRWNSNVPRLVSFSLSLSPLFRSSSRVRLRDGFSFLITCVILVVIDQTLI